MNTTHDEGFRLPKDRSELRWYEIAAMLIGIALAICAVSFSLARTDCVSKDTNLIAPIVRAR